MNAVLKMLKGNQSLEDALQARVDRIVEHSKRTSDFKMQTMRSDGYAQAFVYPKYSHVKRATTVNSFGV